MFSRRRKPTPSQKGNELVSAASSIMATTTAAAATTTPRNMSGPPVPSIEVRLNHHYRSKVYTSGSSVTGEAVITPRFKDIPFDAFQVILLGRTKTKVESVNRPIEATHVFLKLTMPIPESAYPAPRILKLGQTYTVPFNFVIPGYLTINACNHATASSHLQHQHLLMPPSMGYWERNDMAPDAALVEYVVCARAFRDEAASPKTVRAKVLEAQQRLHVLPASAEEPPLSIASHDKLYAMAQSKSLRRNMLSGRLGRLTVEAAQPGAVFVRPDGRELAGSSAMAQVRFRWEPKMPPGGEMPPAAPPTVVAVSGKVAAHTYFSTSQLDVPPNLGNWLAGGTAAKKGYYTASTSLPNCAPMGLNWAQKRRDVSRTDARRDSGYPGADVDANNAPPTTRADDGRQSRDSASTTLGPAGSRSKSECKNKSKWSSREVQPDDFSPPIVYTAAIAVPIQPKADKKTFIPTFHSCIVSRVYSVSLTLSLGFGSGAGATPSTINTVTLTLPLQVAVEADGSSQQHTMLMGLPSFEAAVESAAAAEQSRALMWLHEGSSAVAAMPRGGSHQANRSVGVGEMLPDYADLGLG